jgi:hypothetical protein
MATKRKPLADAIPRADVGDALAAARVRLDRLIADVLPLAPAHRDLGARYLAAVFDDFTAAINRTPEK